MQIKIQKNIQKRKKQTQEQLHNRAAYRFRQPLDGLVTFVQV